MGLLTGLPPGKKLVRGRVSVTTLVNVDLSGELTSIDSVALAYGTLPATTNAFAYYQITNLVLSIICRESDFSPGTTEATIDYIAIGDAPR